MLADELMQTARRTRAATNADADAIVANCEAARVLCRLAALHDDADYRDGGGDRRRTPTIAATPRASSPRSRRARCGATAAHAAAYGLALLRPSDNRICNLESAI